MVPEKDKPSESPLDRDSPAFGEVSPASTQPLGGRDTTYTPSVSPVTFSYGRTAVALCEPLIMSITRIDKDGAPAKDILTSQEIREITDAERRLEMMLGDQYYSNYPVRAAVSSLMEIYKNARDARADQLMISFTQHGDQIVVQITDTGTGFPPEFLAKFPTSSTGLPIYPDLRSGKEKPYESAKLDGEVRDTTGGAGLGLHYLAMITQGAKDGQLYLSSRQDGQHGAQITLVASIPGSMNERAAYGLPDIINYRSQHGEPQTPQQIKNELPPPPAPSSPVSRR